MVLVIPKDPKEGDLARIKALFHILWTRDVGSLGYNKKQWMELQRLLNERGISV